MHRRIALLAAVCFLGAVGAGTARAQSPHLGSHAAYDFDTREPAMGGQLTLPLVRQLELYPSAAYFFVDRGSMWAVNANLKYRLPRVAYIGGGLNVERRSVGDVNNTDTGLNLLGGLESRRGLVHPFMEGRVVLNSGSAFQLAGGLNVTLH